MAAADVASFAQTYPELLEHPERIAKLGKTATDEMKAAAARLLGAGDARAEWPKVDAVLLPLPRDAFGKGHAVPHADITLSPTGHPPASGASDAPPITVAAVKDRVARALPLSDYGVLCAVKATSPDLGGVESRRARRDHAHRQGAVRPVRRQDAVGGPRASRRRSAR